jgi:hypothetical protein
MSFEIRRAALPHLPENEPNGVATHAGTFALQIRNAERRHPSLHRSAHLLGLCSATGADRADA